MLKLQVGVPKSKGEARAKRTFFGFFIGAAVGGVIGYAQGDDPPCSGWECVYYHRATALEKAAGFGLAFGTLASILGYISGSIAPGTNWESVELPVKIEYDPKDEGSIEVGIFQLF